MASLSAQHSTSAYSAKSICKIVGLTCLMGFLVDMVILGLPPNILAIEWRIGFLQQVGDRSIVFLLGTALLIFGFSGNRKVLQKLSLVCLIAGIVFQLFCILVIRDSLTLQQVTVDNINNQATQLQTQLEQSRSNPEVLTRVTPEQLQQANQEISSRAENLRQNAKTGIMKTGFASIGNLVVVGLGLISLGRYGMRQR